MKYPIYLFLLLLLPVTVKAQQPRTADEIMKEAMQQASREQKNILVIFHASWCGWCHKMDASINDPACKDLFEKNYVITHLVVQESENKKMLENPGGNEMMEKFNGKGKGLPFWLVLDKEGKLLGDCMVRPEGADLNSPGQNTGCPASEGEVAHLTTLLGRTSSLKQAELDIIARRFRQNER